MSPSHAAQPLLDEVREERDRAAASLLATERGFRQIVETAGEGIWVIDAESRTSFANQRMADMLGYALAEMDGKSFFDFMDDEGRSIAAQNIELRKQGIGGTHDFKFRRKDGFDLWTIITASTLYDADGAYAGSLAMITDITERRLMETQLRAGELRFRSLVEEMPVGVILYGPDRRIVLANPAARRMFGLTDGQILGSWPSNHGVEVLFEDGTPAPPEKLPAVLAFNTGQPVRDYVTGRRHAETGEMDWFLSTAVPLHAPDGRIASVIVTISDLTERKRTEQALIDSRERFQRTFDNAPIGMAITARSGRFMQVNPALCAMLGYSQDELVNKHFVDITYPDDIEISLTPLRRLLEGEIPSFQLEKRYIRRDGQLIWVHLSTVLVRDTDGNALHLLTQIQDITERRQAEAQLRHANAELDRASRLKSEFLATMSHEIRTPMSGVIGMADLLLDTSLSAQQLEFTRTIRTSAEALLTIINDVLDFSKIEAGRLVLEDQAFDLQQTIEDVVDILGAKVRAKGIELATIVAPTVPRHVSGDAGRLRQTLLNIVSNAVKFTDHGEVVVRITAEKRTGPQTVLRFSITDTGIGIAPEVQQTLFAPFTQADSATTRKYGGTGLGLAICKQLVGLMGGAIGVESALGLGSTFWFTVRLGLPARPDTGEPAVSQDLLHLRLLVVSQNATARMAIQSQVSAWGIAGHTASNEAGAPRSLQRAARAGVPFDIILLDRATLGREGTALVHGMRTGAMPAPHVVLLTTTSLDQLELHQAGIEASLVKPVRASHLFNTLLRLSARPGTAGEHVTLDPITPPSTLSPGARRILVVEDNPINQQVAVWTLNRLGYQTEVAADGREALHLLTHSGFDLVLMDCQMPVMDGYETAREIRRREQGTMCHLPIVAMTANALEGEDEKCYAAGMDGYLAKPVRRDQLAAALDHWLTAPSTSGHETVRPDRIIDQALVDRLRELEQMLSPDLVRTLIETFLQDTTQRIATLDTAMARQDGATLALVAHSLKGSAGNLGGGDMAHACEDLDRAARAGRLDDASSALAAVHNCYTDLRVQLETFQTTADAR